jgi:hypothetical protein
LIKTLATEVKLCEAFEEKAYTYVVEFHEFCFKTLPQSIILAVLKYLGVPDVNIDFFTRFLTENLDIGPGRLVTRAAGVPEHHGAMQLFFTEVIFFFLELAVYKSTGMCLYRIHNTCYFVGTANEALKARKEIDNFGGVTNLSFDVYPGDLHIGFLKLIRRPSLPSTPISSQTTPTACSAASTSAPQSSTGSSSGTAPPAPTPRASSAHSPTSWGPHTSPP